MHQEDPEVVRAGRRTFLIADVEPLDVDGVRTLAVGTAAWFVLFLALLPFYAVMRDQGDLWWLWTCLTGTGLGLIGLDYCRRKRDRRAGDAAREPAPGYGPENPYMAAMGAAPTSAELTTPTPVDAPPVSPTPVSPTPTAYAEPGVVEPVLVEPVVVKPALPEPLPKPAQPDPEPVTGRVADRVADRVAEPAPLAPASPIPKPEPVFGLPPEASEPLGLDSLAPEPETPAENALLDVVLNDLEPGDLEPEVEVTGTHAAVMPVNEEIPAVPYVGKRARR